MDYGRYERKLRLWRALHPELPAQSLFPCQFCHFYTKDCAKIKSKMYFDEDYERIMNYDSDYAHFGVHGPESCQTLNFMNTTKVLTCVEFLR